MKGWRKKRCTPHARGRLDFRGRLAQKSPGFKTRAFGITATNGGGSSIAVSYLFCSDLQSPPRICPLELYEYTRLDLEFT
jgi:hypothetical protein